MPRAWSRFRDQLTSAEPRAEGDPDEPRSGPVCVWRLLASNNRELGRSAVLYRTFLDARAAVFESRLSASEFDIKSVHGPNAGTHGWFALGPDGSPLITCGRWYGAHAASLEAAHHSIEAFQSATVLAEGHRRLSPDRRRSIREAAPTPAPGATVPGEVVRLNS